VDDKIMYMWPQDIIDNTIKAYSRDLNGYTQGAPTVGTFAPANGPDCIETIANGYGDCGQRTLSRDRPVLQEPGPQRRQGHPVHRKKSFQFRFDFLNALDNTCSRRFPTSAAPRCLATSSPAPSLRDARVSWSSGSTG
jgi:hypothetical protein